MPDHITITAAEALGNHINSELSAEELQLLFDAALIDILACYPDAPSDAFRDVQILDWVRNALAYDGVAALSQPGYSASFEERRREIAQRRLGTVI